MYKLIVNEIARTRPYLVRNETREVSTTNMIVNEPSPEPSLPDTQNPTSTNHQIERDNSESADTSFRVQGIPLEDFLDSQLSHQLFVDLAGDDEPLPALPEAPTSTSQNNPFYGQYPLSAYFQDEEMPELDAPYTASSEGFSGDVAWDNQPETRRPPVSVLGDGWNAPETGNGRVSRMSHRTWDILLSVNPATGSGDTPPGARAPLRFEASSSGMTVRPEMRRSYSPRTLYDAWSVPSETGPPPREATSLPVQPETETMREAGTLYDVWNIAPENSSRVPISGIRDQLSSDALFILSTSTAPSRGNSISGEISTTSEILAGALATLNEPYGELVPVPRATTSSSMSGSGTATVNADVTSGAITAGAASSGAAITGKVTSEAATSGAAFTSTLTTPNELLQAFLLMLRTAVPNKMSTSDIANANIPIASGSVISGTSSQGAASLNAVTSSPDFSSSGFSGTVISGAAIPGAAFPGASASSVAPSGATTPSTAISGTISFEAAISGPTCFSSGAFDTTSVAATSGIVTSATSTPGTSTSSTSTSGTSTSGTSTFSIATSGIATSGIATSGIATSGIATSGIATSGIATSGIATSSLDIPSAAPLGATIPSTAISRAITFDAASFEAAVFGPDTFGTTTADAAVSGASTSGTALPGAVPPGAVPPGAVPPGTALPGTVLSGSVPPGTTPPGPVTSRGATSGPIPDDSICNCSKCERLEDTASAEEIESEGGGGCGGCCADLEVLHRLRGRRTCITTSPSFRELVLNRRFLNLTRHLLACKSPDPRRRSAFTRRRPSPKLWRSIAAKQFLYWVVSARNFDRRHCVKVPLCVAAAIHRRFK
ncbi:unnamed protein product [Bemisia tabaci]|uniref:Uncharacterized protein n=1 Tax=Bemisia tabaci TaxID=7038 RepID=A0A9P0FAB9_BEMTA|nr:unnamed protein product [Bemisia tabaci]